MFAETQCIYSKKKLGIWWNDETVELVLHCLQKSTR